MTGAFESEVRFDDLPIDVTLVTLPDAAGDRLFVYVADTGNNRIRRIDLGLAADGDLNHPPIANAGGDQTIVPPSSAPVQVVLLGTGSFDPDGDPLQYTWREGSQVLGHQPFIQLSLLPGLHIITLTVDDGRGGSTMASATITVVNTLSGFTTTLVDPLFNLNRFEDSFGARYPIKLTFSSVDVPGVTTLTSRADFAPPPPAGQQVGTPPYYYDIQTTAVLSGPVRVCVDIRGMSFARPSGIQLYQLAGAGWTPLANQQLTAFGELCGDTQSLGTFAIFYPDVPETRLTRIAGTGFPEGFIDGPGGDPRDNVVDGGAATASVVNRPTYLAVDRSRRLLYTTDASFSTSRVRRIDLNTGIISTVVGPGVFARQSPIALDPGGNILYYVENVTPTGSDQRVSRIDLTSGTSTVVGASGAEIDGLVTDAQGNLFVAQGPNGAVLRVDAATGAVTQVLNETGRPVSGLLSTSFFDQPRGLAFDRQGHLLVGGNRLARISPGADGLVNGSSDETVTWIGGLFSATPLSSLPPYLGDGLHPSQAWLSMYQMFVAADGAVVFGDGLRVRRIAPGSDGIVNSDSEERLSTIAGFYSPAPGGPRSFATERWGSYRGVADDPTSNGIIVADYGDQILAFGYAPPPPPSVFVAKSIVNPTTGQAVSSYTAATGETLTFTLAVANKSSIGVGPTVGPITITDVLDPLLTFDSSTSDSRCAASGQTVTCTESARLDPGFALAFTVKAKVSATAAAVGQSTQLSNRASVSTPGDSSTADNVSQPVVVTVNGPKPPYLEVGKRTVRDDVWRFGVHNGDAIEYEIGVSNDSLMTHSWGPTTGAVVITDTLDARLTFVAAGSDSRCSASGQVVTCTRSAQIPMQSGDFDFFRFVTRVAANAAGLDQIIQIANQATVSSPDNANPIHTADAIAVPVIGPRSPYVEIGKRTRDPNVQFAGVDVGAIIEYEVTVVNGDTAGPTTGPVTVTDTLDSRLTFVPARSDSRCAASGQVVTCTRTPTLVEAGADLFVVAVQVAADAAGPNQTVTVDNRATVSTPNNSNAVPTSGVVSVRVHGLANRPPSAFAGSYAPFEATSPAGATVMLAGSGSDPDPGDTVTFKWSEGATVLGTSAVTTVVLGLGTHTVTLTVTDNHGASATSVAQVVVRDTTAPIVTAPAGITVFATSAAGATVSATPSLAAWLNLGTASDGVDPAPAAMPALFGGVAVGPNTIFPIGTSPVTFSFRDASGNIGTASSTVSVIVGTPQVNVRLAGSGSLGGRLRYVDLEFSNVGTGFALNVAANVIPLTIGGSGQATLVPPGRVPVGTIASGQSRTVRVILDVPPAVNRILLIAVGSFTDVQGTARLFVRALTFTP